MAKKFLRLTSSAATDDAEALASALELHFVDVGQGDAIWIHTPDDGVDGNGRFEGFNIVIDGGPYSADRDNPLLSYLEGVAHHGANVKALIVTHPHVDHYRGAETISRHFDVEDYFDSGYPSSASGYLSFIAALRGTGDEPARVRAVHLGLQSVRNINWGSELRAEFLHSWPADHRALGSGNTQINNASLVLRLQYGEHTFLLMGDAEGKDRDDNPDEPKYVEARLLTQNAERLRANLLKVAHHGSETSSTRPFIEAVNPEIVIVQSGRKNFNGRFLPDVSTLDRYCSHNRQVEIFRTDEGDDHITEEKEAANGDHIIVRSNGRGRLEVVNSAGRRPAHYRCE